MMMTVRSGRCWASAVSNVLVLLPAGGAAEASSSSSRARLLLPRRRGLASRTCAAVGQACRAEQGRRGRLRARQSLHNLPQPWQYQLRALASSSAASASAPSSSSASSLLSGPLLLRLKQLQARHAQLEEELAQLHQKASEGSGGGSLSQQLARVGRELSGLLAVVELQGQLTAARAEAADLQALSEDPDPEMAGMAREEAGRAAAAVEALEEELVRRLLPRDEMEEDEDRAVLLEVRAGTGGDEATLFSGELFAMYERAASKCGWRFEVLTQQRSELGGLKEASATVAGTHAYRMLKFESGVHRVQRVPVNDSRLQTSAATVAVLPEPQDVDLKMDPKDLKFDVYRASGAGGQHVNTTESAVRVTHIPTGVTVAMQDERSQHKNKDKALRILRARLFEVERERLLSQQAAERSRQVGSGDRSERIRTYNFAQDRVTDHRVGLTKHGVARMMEGDLLDEFSPALQRLDEQQRLEHLLREQQEQEEGQRQGGGGKGGRKGGR